MEVYSNQPGVQFYTANWIPEDPTNYKGDSKELETLVGKNGNYYKHGSLCLETQNYPDAINHVSRCMMTAIFQQLLTMVVTEKFPKSSFVPGRSLPSHYDPQVFYQKLNIIYDTVRYC